MIQPVISSSVTESRPATPTEIALATDDFRFVYHKNPDQFFTSQHRPYRLITARPSIETFSNVVYTPTVRTVDQRLGCLYDENLDRIDASCIRRRRHDGLWNTDPERYPGPASGLPVYDPPVIYLGYVNTHYGHFLMEFIARWWPLTEGFGDVDRFLFHVRAPEDLEQPHVKECLVAMGIKPDKIVYFDHSVRLKTVIVPESSFQIDSHMYMKFREFFSGLALIFGADKVKKTEQPLYLSKSAVTRGVRQFIGEEKVEQFLAERGVKIVHPERLPFSEQMRVVNQHRHIIGFQGSQFATIGSTLEPVTAIFFTDQDIKGGMFLIPKAAGHDATYVNVCQMTDVIRTRYKDLMVKITRKWKNNSEGFDRSFLVDYERTTAWLISSGL